MLMSLEIASNIWNIADWLEATAKNNKSAEWDNKLFGIIFDVVP